MGNCYSATPQRRKSSSHDQDAQSANVIVNKSERDSSLPLPPQQLSQYVNVSGGNDLPNSKQQYPIPEMPRPLPTSPPPPPAAQKQNQPKQMGKAASQEGQTQNKGQSQRAQNNYDEAMNKVGDEMLDDDNIGDIVQIIKEGQESNNQNNDQHNPGYQIDVPATQVASAAYNYIQSNHREEQSYGGGGNGGGGGGGWGGWGGYGSD